MANLPVLVIRFVRAISLGVAASLALTHGAPETERRYLSGRGPADAVPWEFSVSGGRRAGEITTIPVPSHWELHGFGTYNYGQEQKKSEEHGRYRTRFTLPPEWQNRRVRLVFDGVMTDASVTVNGRAAGPVHHGGFTRFRYDITPFVKFDAENVLEVDVAKVSADADTEKAERGGDYWVFGGIYRPVWLEAVPVPSIEHVAIDAKADGSYSAEIALGGSSGGARPNGPTLPPGRIEAQVTTVDGEAVGPAVIETIPVGSTGQLRVAGRIDSPRQWTAETPHLYLLRVSRWRGDEIVHRTETRFGFRTFEVRDGNGLYLNGQRILLKGINRHSFRPATGRALNSKDCYADVRLIRDLNMNAVRMSHYPPDEAFLDACDELGLYVLNELSGWHHAHGTHNGRQLVREMVERDVNHPSILFWNNGNEGGWNRELDGEFARHDPQHRRVLHPWDPFSGIDTKHYMPYDNLVARLRGPQLVMPTEILHAMYDGGGGAGLEDYWRAIERSPFGAGLFIWALFDEGVVRTDQNGRIDVFGTFAPDGIVGPRQEKEGSYYAVRDIWSPVQIDPPKFDEHFAGVLTVHNRYDFTSLTGCQFTWALWKFDEPQPVVARGAAPSPGVAPHNTGKLVLPLPEDWRKADMLAVMAAGPDGRSLWNWTWPMHAAPQFRRNSLQLRTDSPGKMEKDSHAIRLTSGDLEATFSPETGMLTSISRKGKTYAFANGPRLAFARPTTAGAMEWLPWNQDDIESPTFVRRLDVPQTVSAIEIEIDLPRDVPFSSLKLEISGDGETWKTISEGPRRPNDGIRYAFPPQRVTAARISDPRRSDGQPATLKAWRIGHAPERFPAEPTAPPVITTGLDPRPNHPNNSDRDGDAPWIAMKGAGGLERVRWTIGRDELRLDYEYQLEGEFLFHGITFDHDEETMKTLRWSGGGPTRVWQNRRRGTWIDQHTVVRRSFQPGEAWPYPEFQGFFGGFQSARLTTTLGAIDIKNATPDIFIRVGTPRVVARSSNSPEFPAGDLSFMHAIPAIGSKFVAPERSGPSGQPAKGTGRYQGTIFFAFRD